MKTAEYWIKREQRKNQAKTHTKEMSEKYADEIKTCIEKTAFYSTSKLAAKKGGQIPVYEVMPLDVVSAIFNADETEKLCVLNFASYKNPGGMFIEGSSAQEESLCHESFLYNVLSSNSLKPGYEYNKKDLNKALYRNHAFYSPDVRFLHNGETKLCDVITCAAPNYTAAHRYCSVTKEENSSVLRDRIRFVLDVMATEQVSCPILGAYGCGVFGQDPEEVARIFKEELETGLYPFTRAIFAIIPSDKPTLETFRKVFS